VITGSGVRLGKAIALALHREGYTVVVHYHGSRQGASAVVSTILGEGGRATALRADIRKPAQVAGLFEAVRRRYGRVDLLVNNAAVFRRATVRSTSEQVWDEAMDTNLKGTFFCAQAAGRIMGRQRGGMIINIASLGGLQAWTEHLPYSVSKAGVIMLTRILAKSLAPSVRVNAIAPGTILMRGEETGLVHLPKRLIPLGKYGTAEDIASLVVYLATKSRYITGQVIPVDGGRSIM
jgi:NAD(P)-dependent dehydrogenase (short-subunit alcohol dehydrogenase family)